MGKSKAEYFEAFQQHLAERFDYLPHTNPNRAGLKLDEHQQDAVREIYEGLTLNYKKLNAVASCGSGKTVNEMVAVSASQAAKAELGINNDRKDIVITEGRTVVTGIRRQFESLGMETGIWSGGKKELEPPIIIAGIQAVQLAIARKTLRDKLPLGSIDLCVIDEVDRFLTQSRKSAVELIRPKIITGFTATQKWPDGRHISDFYGPVVHEFPLLEAMEKRINAIPDVYFYESEIREEDIKIANNDYDPASLKAAWKHAELHKAIPEVYSHLIPANRRRECPTLIYVPSRDLVHATTESMQTAFPDITTLGITGLDNTEVIEAATGGFLKGEIGALVLCEMGGRGMNLENARLLLDAYPTKSLNKLEQRHGRVLRKIRPGSALWKDGWRKNDAIIAQIIPKAYRSRPALFTDIIGGYQELQRIRGEGGGESSGTPELSLVTEIRERLESQKPPVHVSLIQKVDVLEHLSTGKPLFDEEGFFRIPQRYVKQEN